MEPRTGDSQWIHLDLPNGRRYIYPFRPYDTRLCEDKVVATTKLFGRVYKCRLMERIPAWRICDDSAKYVRVEFPELVDAYERRERIAVPHFNEDSFAAPYSWKEDNIG